MKQIAVVYVVAASCSPSPLFRNKHNNVVFVKRQANRVAQSLARATIPLVLSSFFRKKSGICCI